MAGPLPKDPAVKQRRNRVSGAATLAAAPDARRRVPPLPKRTDAEGKPHEWQALTRAWWRDVWRSPMASEYLQADVHGLYRLAVLVDQFWTGPTKELAAEIRLQQQCFGLTPIDRRRLQWEVERVEAVTAGKRRTHQVEQPPAVIEDPRKALRIVGGTG